MTPEIYMKYICQVIIFSSWEEFNFGGFKMLLNIKRDFRNGSKVIYPTKYLTPLYSSTIEDARIFTSKILYMSIPLEKE